ncbi:ribonuclease R [Opitutia bacterium ISCC 51]|nr:ribonuclease R [Opitutae bacterium ISCC 51]QXD26495.1 ribonuclease R [Opitutae bacterium ISCC 52]
MKFKKPILELLSSPDYIPLSAKAIASALSIKNKFMQKELDQALKQLLSGGQIVRIKNGRYIIPTDADLLSGIIRFRQSGSAILLPDPVLGGKLPTPLPIRSEDTGVALHGDRVVVRKMTTPKRLYGKRKGGRRLSKEKETTGRVIEITTRKNPNMVGTLRRAQYFWYVVPDSPQIHKDIVVKAPKKSGLDPIPSVGDKVTVKMEAWEDRNMSPEGTIIEVLGKTFSPGAEYKGVLRKFNLQPEFPADVLAEVKNLAKTVQEEDLVGRQDFTKIFTFTIDPDDAKDFDDALSVEYVDNGNIRIGVHIADVGAYVKPGTRLDSEATKRGNSTYLVGTVIPMLPEQLSNGLCSLKEDVIRLTKSVVFTFSPEGKIRRVNYANSYIRSRKRLTYKQAYVLMKEDNIQAARELPLPPKHQTGSTGRALKELSNKELTDLQKAIRSCWSIATVLRKKRFERGSLDLDMPEVKIYVDEKGYADRMERVENDESHQLIEEFMLAANEGVARELRKNNFPAIYRVHEKPDEQKLYELSETMLTHGLDTGDLNSKREVVKLLAAIKSHSYGYTLRIQFLRSLRQACYMAEPLGHYGLHKSNYTHFTSPIRRYSDLIVHRIFENYLVRHRGQPELPRQQIRYKQSRLLEIAQQVTLREQNSTEAERESVKIKQLEFFEREANKKDKTIFDAAVLEIKNHGLFVELKESLVFGLLPTSSLKDDLYHVSQDGIELYGRRTKKRIRVGETIQVVVSKVDRFKRLIDFNISNQNGGESADEQKRQEKRSKPRTDGQKSQKKRTKPRADGNKGNYPKKKRRNR